MGRCRTQGGHTKRILDKHLTRTMGETVDTIFRYNLADHYGLGDIDAIYQRTIASNCGGLTTYNRYISKFDCTSNGKEIKTFDVNSMYPWIMTGELPYGPILTEQPFTGSYTTWYCIRLRNCSWKGGMACMKNQAFGLKKMCNKPFFVEGKYWNFVLENCDVDHTVEHIYYQRNTKAVEPLIRRYYQERIKYTNQMMEPDIGDDDWERLNIIQKGLKVLMNSLYGKMCEKGYHINVVYNNLKYDTYEARDKKYPCILTGSFITFRARLELVKTIKKVVDAGYDFLYADTDSITLACPKGTDLTPIFGVNTNDLGQWKEEGTFDLYLNNFRKKKYFLANRSDESFKMALSGVPLNIHDILKTQCQRNFRRVVSDMMILFDPEENYELQRCKPTSIRNIFHQQIIVNSNFMMNSQRCEPTGYMSFTEDDYVMERICP